MSNSQGRRREIIPLDEFPLIPLDEQYSGTITDEAKDKLHYFEEHRQSSEGGKIQSHSVDGNSGNC
jgi:hypothetical protein